MKFVDFKYILIRRLIAFIVAVCVLNYYIKVIFVYLVLFIALVAVYAINGIARDYMVEVKLVVRYLFNVIYVQIAIVAFFGLSKNGDLLVGGAVAVLGLHFMIINEFLIRSKTIKSNVDAVEM